MNLLHTYSNPLFNSFSNIIFYPQKKKRKQKQKQKQSIQQRGKQEKNLTKRTTCLSPRQNHRIQVHPNPRGEWVRCKWPRQGFPGVQLGNENPFNARRENTPRDEVSDSRMKGHSRWSALYLAFRESDALMFPKILETTSTVEMAVNGVLRGWKKSKGG